MIDELAALILKFFDGDTAKKDLWLIAKNPLLGGISPVEMIQAGRYDKLLKWAKEQIAENQAPDDPSKENRPITAAKLDLSAMLKWLRCCGYTVAVHNDYYLKDQLRTFWLFTHRQTGTFLKGEGSTDEWAVNDVMSQLPEKYREPSERKDI